MSRWTTAIEARLSELLPTQSYMKIARTLRKEFGATFTEKAVELKARRLGTPKNDVSPQRTVAPVFTIPDAIERVPGDELWALAERATTRDLQRHANERFAAASIDDPLPIGISIISDQHIRQTGPTNMVRMREDAELICRTPGLYGLLGGDGVDNHIKHRAAMVGGGTKVSDEWRLYDEYLKMFATGETPKLLAMISGNHDDWTRDEAGIDMVSQLARLNRVHYAPDEILLTVAVPGQEYRIKVRHQYRYNSSLNLTHTVKRMWEQGQDEFDVGVVGHHHEAAIEPFIKHGRRIWAARPGSYQLTSSFSRRYGYNHSIPTCPTFLLFPGPRHQVMGFWDVWECAEYLQWLRARTAAAA